MSCRGAGYHDIQVDGGVSGVEGYVGSVEGRIFVGVVSVSWIVYDGLFSERELFGDLVDELGEDVS